MSLLNATILVGVITVASTNAKANDWITIDGEMFGPTGYYSDKASGSTLEVDFFTSRGAHHIHYIPYWNYTAFGKTAVTLTGGTFTVNYASGNDRNGPLWAKGGTLEVTGHKLSLEQVSNLTPSYIAPEVALKLKNGAILEVKSYSSVVINENDSIENSQIYGAGGSITFAGGTHIGKWFVDFWKRLL